MSQFTRFASSIRITNILFQPVGMEASRLVNVRLMFKVAMLTGILAN